MVDLSIEGVHRFWYEYDKRTLYRIVTSMEGIEEWAADLSPDVNEAIKKLGVAMDNVKEDFDFKDEAEVVKIIANIRSSRAIRIMQYLDTVQPGAASKLLMYAEDNTKEGETKDKYADLFLKRNLAFERLQLLGRVFAPERINLVLKALEVLDEENN